jgi:hypothetical protein
LLNEVRDLRRGRGYEADEMSRRLKLLFLVRLIPLAERNCNLVELGPRGTGKYVCADLSPRLQEFESPSQCRHAGQPAKSGIVSISGWAMSLILKS